MTETTTCRTCQASVEITRDEQGMIQQLDGSGDVICDACWDAQQAEIAEQYS